MTTMRKVVIESPYAGLVEENLAYLRRCLRNSIERGEAPFASHFIYPIVLDDLSPSERSWGIGLGYEWLRAADLQVFYVDRGWSAGMLEAWRVGLALGKPCQVRSLEGAESLLPAKHMYYERQLG